MNKQASASSEDKTDSKKPAISFGGSTSTFKPLENRPVMKTPEEERREQRKANRDKNRQNRNNNTTESRHKNS